MLEIEIQNKLREKFNPEGSDLRKAQLRMVEMLRFLDSVCRKYGIKYWLDSGTLLGAVRHGGFIPWDDDVDVCMPINDLKKFKKLMLHHKLSDEFVLQCHETDFYFLSASWVVLRDIKSEYIQDSNIHNVRKYRGLQIDIFGVEKKSYDWLHLLSRKYQYKLINCSLQKNHKNIAYLFYIPFRYFFIPAFRLLSIFSKKEYHRLGYGVPLEDTILKETINELSEIEFEKYRFMIPSNPEKYLTNLYGNWSQIPDENNIKDHNVQFVFFE